MASKGSRTADADHGSAEQKHIDAIAQLEKLLLMQQPGNNAGIPQ
jgi:hypothetical protein